MSLVRLGPVDQFPENTCRVIPLANGEPVLVINLEGEIHAMEGHCAGGHTFDHASVVETEGNRVLCPTHGWEIDLDRGVCLAEPECEIKIFPVRIQNGDVWISVE